MNSIQAKGMKLYLNELEGDSLINIHDISIKVEDSLFLNNTGDIGTVFNFN